MLVLILAGCGHSQHEVRTIEDENMDNQYKIKIMGDEDMENTRTIIDAERRKAWTLEWSREDWRDSGFHFGGRNNLDYIIRGSFVPAAYDIDLQTIERFVFTHGGFFSVVGLVIDRMHGRVYYDPSSFAEFLPAMRFSAGFRESDLSRLINAIEKSNLRNWQEFYTGEFDGAEDGGRSWSVGILFSDGSILRRGGSGDRNYRPPEDEFSILFNFIETMGAEIIRRHGLENR